MRAGIKAGAWAVCLVLVSAACSPAWAATYNWTFQEVGPGGGPVAGLAMRTGATWPVVFGQSPVYGNMMTAHSLRPVGWVATPLGGNPLSGPTGVKAESAPNGEVAAVWSTGYTTEYVASSPNGWLHASLPRANSPDGTPDLAFLSDSRPVLAYTEMDRMTLMGYSGASWNRMQINELRDPATGQTINPTARQVSVATDSQGGVNLGYAYNNMVGFAWQDVMTGTWFGKSLSVNPMWSSVTDISLAMGPTDTPGLAFRTQDNRLMFGWYDPRSGAWSVDTVAPDVPSQHVNLVFDQLGNPAMAYVTANTVRLAVKQGPAWATYMLPATGPYLPENMSDVALAFDADNLPVLAYNTPSRLVLAYDPVLAPEPVSAGLVLIGFVLILRRRKAV